jgi:methylglutamate dehydrogenase subunit D
VPDIALVPLSGLEQILTVGTHGRDWGQPGVTLTLCDDVALAAIMCRKGRAEDLQNRVRDRFGVALPTTPKRIEIDRTGFAWAGPGRWLATAFNTPGTSFESTLREPLADLASVVNQSNGRCIVRVGGANARDALAKGVPIDLDPLVFGPGDTALTLAGHIDVHLWQIDRAPTYEFAVFRSFATSFCEWLIEASSRYGVMVLNS